MELLNEINQKYYMSEKSCPISYLYSLHKTGQDTQNAARVMEKVDYQAFLEV